MIVNEFIGFYDDVFSDFRLKQRAEKVMNDMLIFGKVIVNKFCTNNTDKIGAYRMFNNDSYNHTDLAKGLYRSCIKNQQSQHLLCIEDTTELNYNHHRDRIKPFDKDIGPVTNSSNVGFFCHPMLVVDAQKKMPIGISSVEIWNRKIGQPTKRERHYEKLDITEKESYRWLSSVKRTKKILSRTPLMTIIGDRESDIYEELAQVPDDKTHLLIRSSINRSLVDSDKKLFETLADSEQKGVYDIEIKGNKKRTGRKACLSIKYTKVKIQRPDKPYKQKYPEYVQLWAIEARELSSSVPQGESPILWRILTTHPIENEKDARTYIQWYSCRWLIEELFRVIKSKGLEIESAQMETGAALKKIVVMALQIAVTIMSLKLAMQKEEPVSTEWFFSKQQIMFMKALLPNIEGLTLKQKNPFPHESLAWAAWIIARLSGWSGYKSHGPPGYISMKTGLEVFYAKFDGFLIATKLLRKDVYKD
jgi:IS4 transposase